jgi:hypothetical protein
MIGRPLHATPKYDQRIGYDCKPRRIPTQAVERNGAIIVGHHQNTGCAFQHILPTASCQTTDTLNWSIQMISIVSVGQSVSWLLFVSHRLWLLLEMQQSTRSLLEESNKWRYSSLKLSRQCKTIDCLFRFNDDN